MSGLAKVHVVFFCRLHAGMSGPLNHSLDFVRAVRHHPDVGRITVLGNNPLLLKLTELADVEVVVREDAPLFPHSAFVLRQLGDARDLLARRAPGEPTLFYFRYTTMLLAPLLMRLAGARDICVEVNGLPNQALLDRRPGERVQRAKERIYKVYDEMLFRRVDRIFTTCENFRQNLVGRYRDARPIDVIPNGCFPEERAAGDDPRGARVALGLDPDGRYAIYVGHLRHYEGVEFLVRAFVAFAEDPAHENASLLVLGDGPLRRDLELAVPPGLADRVRFLGFLDRALMWRHLAAADVAVFTPPRAEYGVEGQRGGSHLKTVDYLQAGRPVLVPAAPYYDFVERFGLGLRYEPEDAGSFAEKLGILLDDAALRDAAGARARDYCREHLDWMVTLRPVFSVVERLAAGSAP